MKNIQDISYFKYGELCFTEFSISLLYMRGVYNYMGKYVVRSGGTTEKITLDKFSFTANNVFIDGEGWAGPF